MKAVLVFCEGNHDVTFVTRSLGAVVNAKWIADPIKNLPSPFGPTPDSKNQGKPKVESLIAKRYSSRGLDELKLHAAAHAPPPAFEAIVRVDDVIYVLIRCHGDGAAQKAVDLLVDLNSLLNPAFGTDVKEVAAAFLFDADASLVTREATFAKDYAPLLNGAPPTHGQWVKGAHRVGLYVFHDGAKKAGTLEEILAPLVATEWPSRWTAADAYLSAHVGQAEPVATKPAERLKAQITVTGQFRTPGDPMTTILADRRWGLPAAHLGGTHSKNLVSFLQGVVW